MIKLEDRYISLRETCTYLGVSDDTIMKWIKEKEMPAYKIERRWLFKVSEVDTWIKEIGGVQNGRK